MESWDKLGTKFLFEKLEIGNRYMKAFTKISCFSVISDVMTCHHAFFKSVQIVLQYFWINAGVLFIGSISLTKWAKYLWVYLSLVIKQFDIDKSHSKYCKKVPTKSESTRELLGADVTLQDYAASPAINRISSLPQEKGDWIQEKSYFWNLFAGWGVCGSVLTGSLHFEIF